MNSVDVRFAGGEAPSWGPRCAGFATKVLEARGIRDWEVSILLCDDPYIQELNRRYRNLDEPTDVLAFAQQDGGIGAGGGGAVFPLAGGQTPAGDVVISLETMRRNAAARGIGEEEELKRLLIHGILHLEGMDHPEGNAEMLAAQNAEMLAAQEQILTQLDEERVF